MKIHHTATTILFLCLALVSSLALSTEQATAISGKTFTTRLHRSCGAEVVRHHGFDPEDGVAEIEKLENLIRHLEEMLRRGTLTLDYWHSNGLAFQKPGNQVEMTYRKRSVITQEECRDEFDKIIGKGRMPANAFEILMASGAYVHEGWTQDHLDLRMNLVLLPDGNIEQVKQNWNMEPFVEIRFPAAHTGMYLTTRALEGWQRQGFSGTMLALPGMGFFPSTAMSMAKIANLFAKGTNEMLPFAPPGTPGRKPGDRLRMIMIPVDTSLNGMQKDAPFAFGSKRGAMAVTRLLDLYVRTRFPGLARYNLGRSQGGVNVNQYGLHYDDVGDISMNASHPHEDIMLFSIEKYEGQKTKTAGISSMKDKVDKAWEAHHAFTAAYNALNDATPSLGPTLNICHEKDPSYPDDYIARIQSWSNLQEGRQVQVIRDITDEAHARQILEHFGVPMKPEDWKKWSVENERDARHTLLLFDSPATMTTTIRAIGSFVIEHQEELLKRQGRNFPHQLVIP